MKFSSSKLNKKAPGGCSITNYSYANEGYVREEIT